MKELFTELNDRVLRFDGVSIVEKDQLETLILQGVLPNKIRVLAADGEVEQFNTLVNKDNRIEEFSDESVSFEFSWLLPQKYLELDVEQHLIGVFGERLNALNYNNAQTEQAIQRISHELIEFNKRGLYDLLRTIIYVMDVLTEANQVWGVGRGSSCASYILFLLNLHLVDPIVYDISLSEFLHD